MSSDTLEQRHLGGPSKFEALIARAAHDRAQGRAARRLDDPRQAVVRARQGASRAAKWHALSPVVIVRRARLNHRPPEERFKRKPYSLVRQRTEPHDAAVRVGANARGQAGRGKPLHLVLCASRPGRSVVVRIDSVAPTLHRPNRESIRRPHRPGLGWERGVADKLFARHARVDADSR